MTFNKDVYAPLKINLQLSFKLMIPSQLVRLSAEPNQVGFFFFSSNTVLNKNSLPLQK